MADRMSTINIRKASLLITVIVIIGKLFGFLREILLANYFGTGTIVDAYLMSITIPSILFGFLPAIGMGFTPVYFRLREDKRDTFTSEVLLTTVIIVTVCVLLTLGLSQEIVGITAAGFTAETKAITIDFLHVTVYLIALNTPIQVLIAYLNCREEYVYSNLTGLLLSSVQSAFVILAAKINVKYLPYGILVSYLSQLLLLLFFSFRKGFRFRINFDESTNKHVKQLLGLSLPICISNILIDINGFVDKYLGSFLEKGSISALNYAFTIRAMFYFVFTSAVTTIFYPRLSKLTKEGKVERVTELVSRVIRVLILIFVPITIISICMADNIISLVLKRGKFDEASHAMTILPFIAYMVSLTVIALRDLIIKLMYSHDDSKSNLYYGIITVGINVALSVFLVDKLGSTGLAIGTSLANFLTFYLYIRKLKMILPLLNIKRQLLFFAKVVLSCIPAFFIYIILNKYMPIFTESPFFNLLIESGIEFVILLISVLIMMYVLNIEEVKSAMNKLSEK